MGVAHVPHNVCLAFPNHRKYWIATDSRLAFWRWLRPGWFESIRSRYVRGRNIEDRGASEPVDNMNTTGFFHAEVAV